MSGIKKILQRGLLRALMNRRGQGGDWRQNLSYNAPRVMRTALGDIFFAVLAVGLAVMFVVAGAYEFIFASPLSAAFGKATNAVLQATPNEVKGSIMNLPQTDLGNQTVGNILDSAASGISPLITTVLGLLDEIFGILAVVLAVIIRFSHRLLGLLIGDRPANEKGSLFSWIALGGAFLIFIFAVLV